MSKIIFSQTVRYNDIRNAVIDVCVGAITNGIGNVEEYIDDALPELEEQFPEVESFSDTDTRRAAKICVYQYLDTCKISETSCGSENIRKNIDCSLVLNDILHMVTYDSDEYEYEGANAMHAIAELL